MTEQFPHLFSPIKVGPLTVRNRFLYPAHYIQMTVLDPSGNNGHWVMSERAIHYYSERAKGGYGMILVGQNLAHHGTQAGAHFVESVPIYSRIAEAVHAAGAKCLVQVESGTKHGPDVREYNWKPTVVGPGMKGQMAKEADEEDVEYIIEGYVKSARNIKAAGMDGMEIHLTHAHNLQVFMLPAFNQRKDKYGGSFDNRTRIVFDVLSAVRKETGPDFVVGVRTNLGYSQGAFSVDEGTELSRRYAASGCLSYLNVSAWPYFGSTGSERAPIIPQAAAVRAAVDGQLPVFATGDRVVDPRMAEQFLAEGKIDMIGMVRAGIADPELPNKAREGRLDDIRTCVGSGQGCLGYFGGGAVMMCVQNPTVGYEEKWGIGKLEVAPKQKKVMVVGGGPAGLEAALTAARRGHQVVLYEKGESLGGQLNFIRKSPRRDDFRHVSEWRERQLKKLNVVIRLKSEVTPQVVSDERPDTVVVATGSTPRRQARFPGAEGAFTPWDVLAGRLDGKRHVLVVDQSGYYQGSDCAEYLTSKGIKVSFVTAAPTLFAGAPMNDAPVLMSALKGKEITYYVNTSVLQVRGKSVELSESVNGRQFTLEDVDAIVLSVGADPVDGLYRSLQGRVKEVYRVGDCVAPRGIEHATFEGHKTGRSI